MPKKKPTTDVVASLEDGLRYPVLTPFKYGGAVVKRGFVTMPADIAEAYLASGLIGPAVAEAAE